MMEEDRLEKILEKVDKEAKEKGDVLSEKLLEQLLIEGCPDEIADLEASDISENEADGDES